MDNNERKDKIAPNEDINEQDNFVGDASKAELEVEENQIKIISPGRMVLKRFFRSRLSVIGLVTLITLFAFSIIGPFISPWGETQPDMRVAPVVIMDYEYSYTETIRTNEGILEIAQATLGDDFVPVRDTDTSLQRSSAIRANQDKLYQKFRSGENVGHYTREDGMDIYFHVDQTSNVYTIFLLEPVETEVRGEIVTTYSRIVNSLIRRTSTTRILNLNAPPSADHWLGTDGSSYDIFTRLMYAGRISLTLGFVVVFIQTFLGIVLGGIAGYFGKWADLIIMRIIDILICLPGIPIMLIFSAILDGLNVDEGIRIYYLMGMLSLIGWSGTARTVRGQILTLREQEFMVAAEALGLGVVRRISRHLVPNIMPLLIVSMTLGLGGVILSEATLSFLGLGIRPPKAAWGTMISTAQDPIILQYYPNQWVPPGIMIVLAVLAFNFVGDGLRDAFDPKGKR